MSSMNASSFLPIGGPYVSFVRFSTADSMMRCTSSEDVRDEKLMFRMMFVSALRLRRYADMMAVLAVPRSPTSSTGRLIYGNR